MKQLINSMLLWTIIFSSPAIAYAQPLCPSVAPVNYFTYFNPSDSSFPQGSASIAKGILLLDERPDTGYIVNRFTGSASILRTFLTNDTVCMLLTGHQVEHFCRPFEPEINGVIPFLSTIYMNYYGKDSIANGYHYNATTSINKGFLSHGILKAFYLSDDQAEDIALVFINRANLPSNYTELPYDLSGNYPQNIPYHTFSFPHAYPLMFSGELEVTGATQEYLVLSTTIPNATGPGSSGSPLIKPQNSGIGLVAGVFEGPQGNGSNFFPDFNGLQYEYETTDLEFGKLSLIAQEIRNHCWNKNDSAFIASNKSYMLPLSVNNSASLQPYSQPPLTITTMSGLTAIQGTQSISLPNLHELYVKAGNITLSGFQPSTQHIDNNPLAIIIAAKETNLGLDFTYNSSGNSSLNIASVIPDLTASTISKKAIEVAPDKDNKTSKNNFSVFPVPSRNGKITIQFPEVPIGNKYNINVSDLNGSTVANYQIKDTETFYSINIGNKSKGIYLLTIYLEGEQKEIFSTKIIYE